MIELGDARLPDRFWRKVSPATNGCWIWIGRTDLNGYGAFDVMPARSIRRSHRVAFEAVSFVPSGLELDHLCRVRACVNPAHLEPVTHQENCQRGSIGRDRGLSTHCKRGHEYTLENTIVFSHGNGRLGRSRCCRTCKRELDRTYYQQRNARNQ